MDALTAWPNTITRFPRLERFLFEIRLAIFSCQNLARICSLLFKLALCLSSELHFLSKLLSLNTTITPSNIYGRASIKNTNSIDLKRRKFVWPNGRLSYRVCLPYGVGSGFWLSCCTFWTFDICMTCGCLSIYFWLVLLACRPDCKPIWEEEV